MTTIKQRAVTMIQTMPDDYITYVVEILQGLNGLSQLAENQNGDFEKPNDLSKYFGSVNFTSDALKFQKEMRDEWN